MHIMLSCQYTVLNFLVTRTLAGVMRLIALNYMHGLHVPYDYSADFNISCQTQVKS